MCGMKSVQPIEVYGLLVSHNNPSNVCNPLKSQYGIMGSDPGCFVWRLAIPGNVYFK